MSWKYVLVGLALVLPGHLLLIEGRESENPGGTGEDDGSDLKSLLAYLRDRRQNRDPYDVSAGENGQDAPEDFNREAADIAKDEEAIVADDSPRNKPLASDSHYSSGDRGKMRITEIGADVRQPLALAIKSRQESSSSKAPADSTSGIQFIMIVAGCTVLAAIGLVGAGVCWYKYNKRAKSASVVDYPAYGVTGPTKDRLPSPGDRKLAQSAQMYHYQHQKQQMIAMEKANGSMKHDASDEESEEDNVEGDYTVYECPGLAPTGEMEVKNPLFRGDETPSTPVNEEAPQPEDK